MKRISFQRPFGRSVVSVCFLWIFIVLFQAGRLHGDEATLVIKNARVIVGNGQVKDNATVVIKGDRIQSVSAQNPQAQATKTIDAHGKTVMPGLIDTHVHLMSWVAGQGEAATRRFSATEVPKNLETFLRNGVTTIKSLGDPTDLILSLRNDLKSGKLPGPRLLVVGPLFTSVGGHPVELFCKKDEWCRKQFCVEVDDCESARREVCSLVEKGIDAIKILYDGRVFGGVEATKLKKDVMKCIIDEAHQQGLRVTVHTPFENDAIDAVAAGADGLEHGATRNSLTNDRLASLMKENGSFYVPTLAVLESSFLAGRVTKEQLKASQHNLRLLHKQGVRIAVGSDTSKNVSSGEGTIRELELMSEAELSTATIIRSATRNAAEHLGLAKDLGTVEPGKLADLIIVDGDPLADISTLRKIVTVIQAGRIVHGVASD